MIAVLLCAGYAIRLYPLTRNRPKPLLPVADRPVIDYLLDQIEGLPAIDSVHVVTNDRFYSHFSKWYEKRADTGTASIPIHIHNDGTSANADRLGAVADLHFVVEHLGTIRPMLVAAGGNIFRFPIKGI